MLTDEQVERMAEAAFKARYIAIGWSLQDSSFQDHWRAAIRAAWEARPVPEDVPSAEELAEWIGCDMTYARGALHHLAPWLQPRTVTAEQIEKAAERMFGDTSRIWLETARYGFIAAGFNVEYNK